MYGASVATVVALVVVAAFSFETIAQTAFSAAVGVLYIFELLPVATKDFIFYTAAVVAADNVAAAVIFSTALAIFFSAAVTVFISCCCRYVTTFFKFFPLLFLLLLLFFVAPAVHRNSHRLGLVVHSLCELCGLDGAWPHRLRPPLAEETGHRGLVSKAEAAVAAIVGKLKSHLGKMQK